MRGAVPWLRTLPDRFQDELEGLAEGAQVPLQRVEGSLWFTFGAVPAASLGDWQPVAWPW